MAALPSQRKVAASSRAQHTAAAQFMFLEQNLQDGGDLSFCEDGALRGWGQRTWGGREVLRAQAQGGQAQGRAGHWAVRGGLACWRSGEWAGVGWGQACLRMRAWSLGRGWGSCSIARKARVEVRVLQRGYSVWGVE